MKIEQIRNLAVTALSRNTCMAGRESKKISEIRGNGTAYTIDEVGAYFMDDVPMGSNIPNTDEDGNVLRKMVGVCHFSEIPEYFFSPGTNFNRFLTKMYPYFAEDSDDEEEIDEEEAFVAAMERLSADIKAGGGLKVRVDSGTKRNGQPFNKLVILE